MGKGVPRGRRVMRNSVGGDVEGERPLRLLLATPTMYVTPGANTGEEEEEVTEGEEEELLSKLRLVVPPPAPPTSPGKNCMEAVEAEPKVVVRVGEPAASASMVGGMTTPVAGFTAEVATRVSHPAPRRVSHTTSMPAAPAEAGTVKENSVRWSALAKAVRAMPGAKSEISREAATTVTAACTLAEAASPNTE